MNKYLIRQEVEKRNIKYLLHFTKLCNIESIIKHGLITRDKVLAYCNSKSINDEYRFDQTNGICLSISFPNYKMFYSCRDRSKDEEWIVLGIRPNILWEKNCAFYYKNAASKIFRFSSLNERMTYQSFVEMFGEHEKSRKELEIPENFTTNPQAEIIVLEDIPKNYIFAYATQNIYSQKILKEKYPDEKFHIKSEFFSYRRDYAHWRAMENTQ